MKYLSLIMFIFLFFSCTKNKTVFWCGDHACVNKDEKESYFKKTMTVQIKESNGSVNIPKHTHPSKGIVYLLKGQVEVDIEGVKTIYKEGESWIEPQNKLHSGKSIGPIKYFVVYHHPTGRPYIN